MAEEREFGWDDEIENDNEFQILPDGDYNFTVTGFERGRHQGSAKLPPCNKAIITLNVADGKGNQGTIKHNLFLHTKTEGMLCAFFIRNRTEKAWRKVPYELECGCRSNRQM